MSGVLSNDAVGLEAVADNKTVANNESLRWYQSCSWWMSVGVGQIMDV